MRPLVPPLLLALALAGCAAPGASAQGSPPDAPPPIPLMGGDADASFPLTGAQRAAGVVVPRIGDRVQPGPDGWFACSSQRLVMAAWFARLARHAGAVRALFANEGDGVDCVHLTRGDPSIASIRVVDAKDDRLGDATIRLLTIRIFFTGEPPRSVEMSALSGVAGGFEVLPPEPEPARP
jgi:hypothetical protein